MDEGCTCGLELARASDALLEDRFPHIAWRTPIKITVGEAVVAFGCRLCIGRYGLSADLLKSHPTTGLEFEMHMAKVHGNE